MDVNLKAKFLRRSNSLKLQLKINIEIFSNKSQDLIASI